MSLTSLAEEEIVRTDQAFLRQRLRPLVDKEVAAIIPKYQIPPAAAGTLTDDLLPLAAQSPTEKTTGSNALDSLARYIPTEVITLYVAAASAMPSIKTTFTSLNEVGVFWAFVVLTPVLFVLIFVGKRQSQGLPALPASIRKWPWWKMIASTIAFFVWALAIPATPYLTGESGKVVAAFGALLVSTFLTLLEPIFEPAS